MNGKYINQGFFEEQLCETQQALFTATTVKQIKFLQNKIKYLKALVKEQNGRK